MKSWLVKHCSTISAQRARLRLDSSFITSPTMYLTAFTVSGAFGGDGLGVGLDVALELGLRHHSVDEAHRQRLRGVELARGKEDLAREGGPDHVGEPAQAGIGIAEPELGRRTAKRELSEQMRRSQQTARPSPPPMQ